MLRIPAPIGAWGPEWLHYSNQRLTALVIASILTLSQLPLPGAGTVLLICRLVDVSVSLGRVRYGKNSGGLLHLGGKITPGGWRG